MDFHVEGNDIIRKQSFAAVLQNRCSWKFRYIIRKTAVLESLLNIAAGLKTSLHRPERLLHRCFPVNIVKFLRAPIFKEHLLRLLFYYLIASRSVTYFAPQYLINLTWLFLLTIFLLHNFYSYFLAIKRL